MLLAAVSAGGVIGPWKTAATLPAGFPHTNAAMAITGGRVYLCGGEIRRPRKANESVRSAAILGDGLLGPWRVEPSLTAGREEHAMLVVGSTLVVAGGTKNAAYFTEGTREVELATIGADGALSPWKSVPAPIAAAANVGAGAAGGRLFVMNANEVRSAPVAGAYLGEWRKEPIPTWQDPDSLGGDFPPMTILEVGGRTLAFGRGLAWTSRRTPEGSLGAWAIASAPAGDRRSYAIAVDALTSTVIKTGGTGLVEGVAVWTTRQAAQGP